MKELIKEQVLNEMVLPPKRYQEPFIIALCGYSGSGKSTVCRVLSHELEAFIIAGDYIRNKIYEQDPNCKEEEMQRITNEIYKEELEKVLHENCAVVIDRSVSEQTHLEKLRSLATVILIKLSSTDEINLERILNRDKPKVQLEIGEVYGNQGYQSGVNTKEMYELIKARKKYDIADEEFDYMIDATQDMNGVVDQTKVIAKEIKQKTD